MFKIAAPTQIEGMPSPFFIILNFTLLFIGSRGRFPRAAALFPLLMQILPLFFFFSISDPESSLEMSKYLCIWWNLGESSYLRDENFMHSTSDFNYFNYYVIEVLTYYIL